MTLKSQDERDTRQWRTAFGFHMNYAYVILHSRLINPSHKEPICPPKSVENHWLIILTRLGYVKGFGICCERKHAARPITRLAHMHGGVDQGICVWTDGWAGCKDAQGRQVVNTHHMPVIFSFALNKLAVWWAVFHDIMAWRRSNACVSPLTLMSVSVSFVNVLIWFSLPTPSQSDVKKILQLLFAGVF